MFDILNEISLNQKIFTKIISNLNNKKQINKWLQTELTYTSNAIEGNTLTRKETQLVIDEQITSSSKPVKDYLEAINHSNAFKRVLFSVEEGKSIDENFMLEIHKIILNGLDYDNAGFYRNCRVRISGSNVIMPNPVKVPDLMNEFYFWLNNNFDDEPITAILSHLKFVSIHPFVDGNGRCARLLMNAILLKFGYPPIIVRPMDRKKYLSAIEIYQLKGDDKPYLNLMLNLLNRSLKMLIKMFDLTVEIEQTKLLTIAKFAKLNNVPISTIRYWVKIGKIEPASYTNAGYMLFENKKL